VIGKEIIIAMKLVTTGNATSIMVIVLLMMILHMLILISPLMNQQLFKIVLVLGVLLIGEEMIIVMKHVITGNVTSMMVTVQKHKITKL
jgi:hypothetical protein